MSPVPQAEGHQQKKSRHAHRERRDLVGVSYCAGGTMLEVKTMTVRATMTIAILLFAAGAGRASLVAYEPFDYAEGQPVNGLGGGTGWGGSSFPNWDTSSGTVATVASPGLSAPGGIPQVGHSMLISAGTNVGAGRTFPLLHSGAQFPNSPDHWFSFVMQRGGTPGGGAGEVLSFKLSQQVIVYCSEAGTFQLSAATGGSSISPILSPGNDPFLLVLHAGWSPATNGTTLDLFINPVNGPINPIASVAAPANLMSLVSDMVFLGNLSSDVRIDEVRIGTTFLDVAVPSPAPSAVMALGLLAAGRRRRTSCGDARGRG